MSHVCEDGTVKEDTRDAVREVLELTNSIVLEVKATAGAGGSIMAAANKLEEVGRMYGTLVFVCPTKSTTLHIALGRVQVSECCAVLTVFLWLLNG